MNSSGVSTPSPANLSVLDPQTIVGDLEDVKKSALKTLQESFHILGNFSATGSQSAAEGTGLPDLEKPSLSKQVNDLTLRIGLLQDALNQLLSQVSRTEIQQRMNDMQKENQRQLEKFNEQMEKAAEAAEKAKESEKKGNIFEAVSNWIQAVVSIVSAVFTLISAAAQILTNPVGAAGLIVAGVALIGAAAVQITLAIDATMLAAGKEGFLSDADKTKMKKAVEILGYIALAGSMIGLVGGVVVALGQAGRAAATVGGQQIGRVAATTAIKTGAKEVAASTKDAAINTLKNVVNTPLRALGGRTLSLATNTATRTAAVEAYKQSMLALTKLGGRMAITQLVGQSANLAVVGVGKERIADLNQEASDLQAEADKAEAAAKALEATIAKLRALIEQLQQELEHMVEEGQQTMSIIFGAIDESAKSMTQIQQTISA